MEASPRWDEGRLRAFASEGWMMSRDSKSREVPVPAWLSTLGGTVTLADDHYPPALSEYYPADCLLAYQALKDSFDRPNEIVENVARWRDGDQWRLMMTRRVNLLDDERVGVMLISFTDIGTAEIAPSAEVVAEVLTYESPPWAIQHLDSIATILDSEGRVEELVGRSAAELVGTSAIDLIDPTQHAHLLLLWVELTARTGEVRTVQLRVKLPDGTLRWAEATLINRLADDHGGSVVAVFHDISEKRSADESKQAALTHRAAHDPLTQMLNRASLDERLEAALLEGSDDVVVLFLDLDAFKSVNDTFGHDAGDIVLQAVAERLRSAVRPTDDVGRYGGDEFVAVCREVAPGAEHALVERVATALDEPVAWPGGSWVPRASIGAARHRPGDTVASLLRRADAAMFEKKRSRHTGIR
jgi:diguanylate cyclase (GGDEF)-like protein/PAS domain S-box-containing protein